MEMRGAASCGSQAVDRSSAWGYCESAPAATAAAISAAGRSDPSGMPQAITALPLLQPPIGASTPPDVREDEAIARYGAFTPPDVSEDEAAARYGATTSRTCSSGRSSVGELAVGADPGPGADGAMALEACRVNHGPVAVPDGSTCHVNKQHSAGSDVSGGARAMVDHHERHVDVPLRVMECDGTTTDDSGGPKLNMVAQLTHTSQPPVFMPWNPAGGPAPRHTSSSFPAEVDDGTMVPPDAMHARLRWSSARLSDDDLEKFPSERSQSRRVRDVTRLLEG